MTPGEIERAEKRPSENRKLVINIAPEEEFSESVAELIANDSEVDTLRFESLDEADGPFTTKRLELLRLIISGEAESKSALAEETGRDRSRVNQDLDVLENYPFPLISYEWDGRKKRPVAEYDEIIIHVV
jgi:predicted transcriptional regulator